MDITVALYTLIAYKVLLLSIGIWSQKRTKNNSDYFLGGRNLGPVVAAISYGASTASAWTLLGLSGAAYVLGFAAIWMVLGAIGGCIIAWVWIAPRLMQHSRKRQQLTLTEFLAEPPGNKKSGTDSRVALLASIVILASFVFYIAAQFQGAATTFSSSFPVSFTGSLILGAAVITLYTFFGGFWAASITDTIQGGLMLVAAILLPLAALLALVNTGGDSLSNAVNTSTLALTASNSGLAAIGFIAGSLAVGVGTFGQPHLLNRFMALAEERSLRKAQILSISWFSLVFAGTFSLGIMGRSLLPALEQPETLFFQLSELLLHPVIAAILLAAVLSAIMSTADSMLLVVASTIAHDLNLQRLLPGRELLVARLSMLAVAIAAVAIALFLPATIFERVLFAWIAIGSAFGPTVFARLAGASLAPTRVLYSIGTGFVLAVALYLLPDSPGNWAERLLPFLAASLMLLPGARRAPSQAKAEQQAGA